MRYILLLFLACLFLPFVVHAEDLFPEELLPTISTDPYNTLKGGQYQLELLPYEKEVSPPSPTPEKKQDTLLPKDRRAFDQYGYIVKETEGELTIALSTARVNLGSISGSNIHTGSSKIAISTSQSHAYSLLLQQKNEQGRVNNWQFQPTRCDDGYDTCTSRRASEWKQDRAYGFGYSALGSDLLSDFKNESYFRIFDNEIPITIAKNDRIDGIRATSLRYKLITPPSTQEAIYNTNVEIIVLPY